MDLERFGRAREMIASDEAHLAQAQLHLASIDVEELASNPNLLAFVTTVQAMVRIRQSEAAENRIILEMLADNERNQTDDGD